MGHLDGRLRIVRRHLQQLHHCAGRRQDHSGRHLCPRLPAAARKRCFRALSCCKRRSRRKGSREREASARLHARRCNDENPTVSRLRTQFPLPSRQSPSFASDVTVTIARPTMVTVCRFLHDDPDLAYVFLVDLTSVDYSGVSRRSRRALLSSTCSTPTRPTSAFASRCGSRMTARGAHRDRRLERGQLAGARGLRPDGHHVLRPSRPAAHSAHRPTSMAIPCARISPSSAKQEPVVRIKGSARISRSRVAQQRRQALK